MPNIYHQFVVEKPVSVVFDGISQPELLDRWWTKHASGQPKMDAQYKLFFGPEYDWVAKVTVCDPPKRFELQMTKADKDWMGTQVGFELQSEGELTIAQFYHQGWPDENDHFKISSYCWAMYLRILKRYLETGEVVPYENRLKV